VPLPPNERNIVIAKLAGVLVLVAVLCAGALMPFVGGAGLLAKTQSDKFLTTSCNLQETQPPQQTVFYANDGKTKLATLFLQDRKPVPLGQIPKYLQQALVATEDRRFYSHTGVDMRGLLRSAFSTTNGDTQGGSTLTMQYVKQVRYYQAATTSSNEADQEASQAAQEAAISQNLNRKIEDANCAIYLESGKKESKDQILTNYLNIAFFGENAYSVQSAAETYFGKAVGQLSLPQSAMLVGLLKAPTQYDPIQHPKAAMERRNQVIDNLADVGDISSADAEKYKAEPMGLTTARVSVAHSDCTSAQIANSGFFCEYLRRWLMNNNSITDHTLFTGGLNVVTTLDANLQTTAQAALTKVFAWTPKAATAAMPIVDPKTGNVLAMVSNRQYGLDESKGQTELGLFTDPNSNAGSTFKYFTMIAALKAGATPKLTLGSPHGPYTVSSCPDGTGGKGIKDASPTIPDTLSMDDAFAYSSNKFFVGLEDKFFSQCDLTPVIDTAADLGLDELNQPLKPGTKNKETVGSNIAAQAQYSFTLGRAVSPLKMAAAYAAAANDGIYCPPSPVLSISDANGNSLPVKRGACTSKFNAQVARNALTVMAGESKSPGTAAPAFAGYYAGGGSPVVGKTGTTEASTNATLNSSAWYIGVTPSYSAAMAMFDPAHPYNPIPQVPGVKDGQAQGTDAARMWVGTLGATIVRNKWTWPSPNVLPQGVTVPNVVGMTADAATAKLSAAGFKLQNYGASFKTIDGDLLTDLRCAPSGKDIPGGNVAYQSPTGIALPGSTVTVCLSNNSKLQTTFATPKASPKVTPKPSPGARVTPRPGG